MLFAAINSGIEFGINFLPVDEEAKEWMKRANDGLAVAADVVVGGGTSTAAIVAKAVLREVGDRVVPADDKTAQQIFQASSAVVQTAAGSAGAGIANAAAASSQAATTSLATQAGGQMAAKAGEQAAAEAARSALQEAAAEAGRSAATQLGGGAAGAGVGYAIDGTDGLQTGAQVGLAASAGDWSDAGFKAAGAAAGGAIGYATGPADARMNGFAAGAAVGTRVGALGSGAVDQNGDAMLGQGLGLAAGGASAGARVAAGQSADQAIFASDGIAGVATSGAGTNLSADIRGAGKVAGLAAQGTKEGLSAAEDVVHDRRERELRDALSKQGGRSEELRSKLATTKSAKARLAKAQEGLGTGARLGADSTEALQLRSFRADQMRLLLA